jgi:hypothetical protein
VVHDVEKLVGVGDHSGRWTGSFGSTGRTSSIDPARQDHQKGRYVGLGPMAASVSNKQATTDVLAEMAPVTIAPGEHAAPEHVRSGRFQAGVAVGRRGLQTVTWLLVVATVNAAEYQVDQLVTLYAWRLPASTGQ